MTTTKVTTGMFAAGAASKTASFTSSANENQIVQLNSSGELPEAIIPEMSPLRLDALSADPENPADGSAVLWMSDGTGSGDDGDIFIKSTAGITTAVYTNAVDYNGFTINDSFTITVAGTAYTVLTEGVDATGSASTTSTTIAMGCSSGPSAGTVAETIVDAINGKFGSGGAYNHAFASANTGVNTGVPLVTATLSGSTQITITSDTTGAVGNTIAVANVVGNAATNGSLSGGADASTKLFKIADWSSS